MKLLSLLKMLILEPTRSLEITGVLRKAVTVISVLICLYHLYVFTLGSYDQYIHRVIHVCTILMICFLTLSYSKNNNRLTIIDLICALLCIVIMTYLVVNGYRLLYIRIPVANNLTPFEVGLGTILLLLVFEASRRVMGSILTILALICLLYAYFGPYISGMWAYSGMTLNQIIDLAVFGDRSLFGSVVGVSATYIILFLIFAGLLQNSGATEFFNDLALSIAGKARGGPAKVAVLGSSLIGMISGSAAANVAVTGSVTIPMMKKAGFQPSMAGGIESAASTGGHIMPPIMSGVVFVMADILGMRYWNIVAVAFIPAILYFLGIFIQVHAYSVKNDLRTSEAEFSRLPKLSVTLKKGSQHFLPLIVIVGLLAYGFSPIRAALYSMPIVIIVSWFRPETRMGFKAIIGSLVTAIKMIRVVMLATGTAGILMGFLFVTGAGSNFISIIQNFSNGNLLLSLIIAAIFCLFLGLTLSGLASYLLTAILIAPAAVAMGVPALSIHFFALYYASVALITPPVGPVSFQAAALANAGPYLTGFTATRLAIAAFIVPFIWIYWPGMLFMGTILDIIAGIFVGIGSVVVLAFALEGYLFKRMHIAERSLLIVGVLFVVFGNAPIIATGFLAVLATIVAHWFKARRLKILAST